MSADIKQQSVGQQLYDSTSTPFPAWAVSSMLLATPIASPAILSPSLVSTTSKGRASIANVFARPKYVGPTTKVALLFGAAQALGGWIVYDGDLESGSGFITAWSTLYLIVGGRGSIKALRYGRVWPLLLTTASLTNAVLYGKRFVSGGFV